MDEVELRIAAVEKVILALAPWLSQAAIEDALCTLQAELQTVGADDERVPVTAAIDLLRDGARRFKGEELSLWLRGGKLGRPTSR